MANFSRGFFRAMGRVGLIVLTAGFVAAGQAAEPTTDQLIVPGERIGGIKLGGRTGDSGEPTAELGEQVYSDAATGRAWEAYYVGTQKGDRGKPFRRPKDIIIRSHRDEEGHHYIITGVAVTSPLYATAEGIKPGSLLTEIQGKFSHLTHDKDDNAVWPGFGKVDFYGDPRRGITFAVSVQDARCVEIEIREADNQPGEGSVVCGLKPSATGDFQLSWLESCLGDDLKLGMSGEAALDLLGKPTSEADLVFEGLLWRWRLPFQKPDEAPALGIVFAKLPDGRLSASCLRVSSPLFQVSYYLFPGCKLKEVLLANAYTHWLGSFEDKKEGAVDLYGDYQSGEVMEVRRRDGICTAICLVPHVLGMLTGAGQSSR